MTDWTHGYVSDISYDYSFFPELSPTNLAFNLLDHQFFPPSFTNFTYCELGCGQGFTTNVLAATNPQGNFWGIDFNPNHIAAAQRLATSAQLNNIQFSDNSFEEFLTSPTPQFDFIALHGIYSWINDENRKFIVQILSQKLKVGGAVYISYNALPGWSNLMPLRELMVQYTEGTSASTLQKVEQGLEFAQTLQALNAGYFMANPSVKTDLEAMQDNSPVYIGHEYFNQNSYPFYHSKIVQQLAEAKLNFAASAEIGDQFDNLKLNQEQRQLLDTLSNSTLQETIRDFILNTRFRKDLFVKGSARLSSLEQAEILSRMRFALLVDPENIYYKIKLGERAIQLDENIYKPLVNAIAHSPQTLRDLMRHPALSHLSFATILQALKILMTMGDLSPALPEEGEGDRQRVTSRFNLAVLKRSRFGAETPILASPITGSGIEINRAEQLFLLALIRQVDPIVFTWNVLQIQGERLLKDDKVLESPEENQAELQRQFQLFQETRLPLLRRLGVI
ncbi:MAG: class I SAM-dependent methyltransferase [Leptolyngbyaceae bacterium]|nr:class I SAM-dependent methyltransferase [Leptolyngbyaceae bacterium]